MPDNYFDNHADAKRAMKENLFSEVYLSTAATAAVRVKGWVSHVNPYERHGRRWYLYVPRIEIVRRWFVRSQKNLLSPSQDRPA
jgi:hypothetical protein